MLLQKYPKRAIVNALLVLTLICTSLMVYFVFQNQDLKSSLSLLRKENISLKVEKSELKEATQAATEFNNLSIRKKINNITYKLKNKPDNPHAYQLGIVETDSGKFSELENDNLSRNAMSFVTSYTTDFWIEPENDTIYLVNNYYPTPHENIAEVQIQENENALSTVNYSLIFSGVKGGVYTRSRINQIYPERNQLLIYSRGGDGCGGQGEWWLLGKNGSQQTIINTSSGCVMDEYRFGKKIDNQLIVADAEPAENYSNEGYITNLYAVDIFTGVRTPIPFNPPEQQLYDLVDAAFFQGNYQSNPPLNKNEVILRQLNEDRTDYAYNIETQEFHPIEITRLNN